MIHFVTTRAHDYTVRNLVARQGAEICASWSWESLFELDEAPVGTWVFTDHERLAPLQIREAARIAARLREGGARILNDPTLVRSRLEILRRLERAGINRFSAYRADSAPRPSRFPVFLRNSFDHDARQMKWITDQPTLDAELERVEANGESLIGKLVIEYAGEEFAPGVWRRYSTYRVAGKLIHHHVGFDDSWIVKDGFSAEALEAHPQRERMLEIERDFVGGNRWAEVLTEAFSIARIDYGRVDFSVVDDRVQVYEINTNPNHGDEREVLATIHPRRRSVQKSSEDLLNRAIRKLGRQRPMRRLARAVGIGGDKIRIR